MNLLRKRTRDQPSSQQKLQVLMPLNVQEATRRPVCQAYQEQELSRPDATAGEGVTEHRLRTRMLCTMALRLTVKVYRSRLIIIIVIVALCEARAPQKGSMPLGILGFTVLRLRGSEFKVQVPFSTA